MTGVQTCALPISAVYAAEKLCEGKHFPLCEKYGPWVQQNKVQAIAVIAAVLYGASLALWPEGLPGSTAPKDDGFEPC